MKILNIKYFQNKTFYDKISLILFVSALVVALSMRMYVMEDDAFISFRYAYNLAHHGELVLNLGERVEGATNLLWLLILALQFILLNFPVEQFTLFLSLSLIVFTSFRIIQSGLLLGAKYPVVIAAALLLVLNPEFIGAATNGLEAALYSALQCEVIYRYCRSQITAAYFFAGLLFMTRPEGLIAGIILFGIIWIEHNSLRKQLTGLIIFGAIITAVTLFRLFYYGMPVPNSIIAKSYSIGLVLENKDLVISYFYGFIVSNPYLIVIFVASIFYLFKTRSLRNKSFSVLIFCLTFIAFSFFITIRNGGDWMDNHRLLLQYGVMYSVLLVILVKKRIHFLLVCIFLIIPFYQTSKNLITYRPESVLAYEKWNGFWAETAKLLDPVLNKSDIVSAEALGFISYYLKDNRFHDPVGLADKYIAWHGRPSIPFGKHHSEYTVGVVKPSVMVWQTTKHMQNVNKDILDNYSTFCYTECETIWADVVMIRRDRLMDLAPAFAGWKKIPLH